MFFEFFICNGISTGLTSSQLAIVLPRIKPRSFFVSMNLTSTFLCTPFMSYLTVETDKSVFLVSIWMYF
jgi:hypothetical protein